MRVLAASFNLELAPPTRRKMHQDAHDRLAPIQLSFAGARFVNEQAALLLPSARAARDLLSGRT
jgi:hypothetical protein